KPTKTPQNTTKHHKTPHNNPTTEPNNPNKTNKNTTITNKNTTKTPPKHHQKPQQKKKHKKEEKTRMQKANHLEQKELPKHKLAYLVYRGRILAGSTIKQA